MNFRRLLFITGALVLGGVLAFVFIALYSYRTGMLQRIVVDQVAQSFNATSAEMSLLEQALGMDRPRTYLFLFLNNTELRPGGGFIGSYAVVRFDRAIPHLVKVEGTELLDNYAPQDFPSVPPDPLKTYLAVNRWNFRDSNWSPDYPTSAQKALELYRKEKGVEAATVDGVIGFTPTLFEEILRITGPVTLNGETFTADNFTEKLEYDVEYGYAGRGLSFNDRKQMLADLTKVMVQRLGVDLIRHWSAYWAILPRLLAQKQVVLYSLNSTEEQTIEQLGWGGQMHIGAGDYLLWADANLGAKKTDVAIERTLSYSLAKDARGMLEATAHMHYVHHGVFDWRTTRYLDYVRIFVPVGSSLVSVNGAMLGPKDPRPGPVSQGIENGRQWFGAFISIEPQHSGDLSFTYVVAPAVQAEISLHAYGLEIQKQIGTIATPLTIDLGFDTKVVAAHPSETPDKIGDRRYQITTDLSVDRTFTVQLGN